MLTAHNLIGKYWMPVDDLYVVTGRDCRRMVLYRPPEMYVKGGRHLKVIFWKQGEGCSP